MSFITRAAFRPIARSNVVALAARPISSSALRSKTATETTKETLDSVNKKVGQTLASGIENAENAAETVKKTVGVGSTEEAKQKAGAAANAASHKANETATQARQKTNETMAGARETKDELLEKGKSS